MNSHAARSASVFDFAYAVTPGQYETIYANMPRFGLGAAADHVPVVGRLDGAKLRMEKLHLGHRQHIHK